MTLQPYESLTSRGQARRLRCLALDALGRYDLEIAHLRLVTNNMNGIFRVDTTDGKKYILRVSRPVAGHIRDHIIAEMDWLDALARETDLSVPRPMAARDESLVVEAQADGVPERRFCVIFTWLPGKDLAEDMSTSNIERMGELSATLHMHALKYQPPAGLDLLHFDRVFPFPDPFMLFDETHLSLFPAERKNVYQKAIDWVQESIDRLIAGGEKMRILHGDLHQWNVRNARGRLSPIDFEDLMFGWPVQDIATTLYYFPTEQYASLRSAFQAGYVRCIPWPERYAGEIASFIAARGIGLVNFVLGDFPAGREQQAEEFVAKTEKQLRALMSMEE